MISNETIRERLNEAIKQSGLKQTEIAKKVGIKQPTVSQYISGKANPSLETFANICIVLDADPAYILGITDNIGNRNKE